MAARALAAGLEAEAAVRHAGLIMEPGVALQAKLPPLAPYQQHAVGAAVRGMARGAALHFHRRMLIDVRPALFRVAVHTGF